MRFWQFLKSCFRGERKLYKIFLLIPFVWVAQLLLILPLFLIVMLVNGASIAAINELQNNEVFFAFLTVLLVVPYVGWGIASWRCAANSYAILKYIMRIVLAVLFIGLVIVVLSSVATIFI